MCDFCGVTGHDRLGLSGNTCIAYQLKRIADSMEKPANPILYASKPNWEPMLVGPTQPERVSIDPGIVLSYPDFAKDDRDPCEDCGHNYVFKHFPLVNWSLLSAKPNDSITICQVCNNKCKRREGPEYEDDHCHECGTPLIPECPPGECEWLTSDDGKSYDNCSRCDKPAPLPKPDYGKCQYENCPEDAVTGNNGITGPLCRGHLHLG